MHTACSDSTININEKNGLQETVKATPHKARLTTGARLAAWQRIYLHIFRHLARKLLAGRMFRKSETAQFACKRASAQRRRFHTI